MHAGTEIRLKSGITSSILSRACFRETRDLSRARKEGREEGARRGLHRGSRVRAIRFILVRANGAHPTRHPVQRANRYTDRDQSRNEIDDTQTSATRRIYAEYFLTIVLAMERSGAFLPAVLVPASPRRPSSRFASPRLPVTSYLLPPRRDT